MMDESIWNCWLLIMHCLNQFELQRLLPLCVCLQFKWTVVMVCFRPPGLLESARWIRIDSCVFLPLDKSLEFLWEDQVKVGSMFNLEVERQGLFPLHKKNNQWKRSKITAMVPWFKTLDSAHIYQLISLLPLAIFVSLFVVLIVLVLGLFVANDNMNCEIGIMINNLCLC